MAVPLFNLCRGYPAHANPARIGGSGSVQAEVWTGQVVQVGKLILYTSKIICNCHRHMFLQVLLLDYKEGGGDGLIQGSATNTLQRWMGRKRPRRFTRTPDPPNKTRKDNSPVERPKEKNRRINSQAGRVKIKALPCPEVKK
jgi:hypothetical protein